MDAVVGAWLPVNRTGLSLPNARVTKSASEERGNAVQGFAVVDSQPESPVVAIWHTTRVSGAAVEHTNAVAVDFGSDPAARRKAHALTRDRVVLLTPGSTIDLLPVSGDVMTSKDVDDLVAETTRHQDRILDAVNDYVRRTRKNTIVRPNFMTTAITSSSTQALVAPTERALSLANYLARAWRRWLLTDEERLRRTTDSNGISPWMMPPELGSQELAALPTEIATRAAVEPVEAFDA